MNFFLKREVSSPEVSDAHNPYLAARREWDERYGDLITRARNWRVMAALCSLVALVATAGMVSLSARSHVVPFVVLVDNLGRPIASGVTAPINIKKRSEHGMSIETCDIPTQSGA